MANKTIRCQAWINGDTLVQDCILVTPGAVSDQQTDVLVSNIWDDLLSENGKYKTNGRGYFYWEYKMTDHDNDDVEVTVFHECPKPKEDLFTGDRASHLSNPQGEYAKYWVGKIKTAQENYEKSMSIQKKDITLKGTTYLKQNGESIELKDMKVANDDLSDITNLLGLFSS